jgi:hypothetical protein
MESRLAMLLDIIEVPCSHTGLNLALAFVKVLKDFGISKKVSDFLAERQMTTITHLSHLSKILGVTADNVSNNDTMIDELSVHLEDFSGTSNQTRCFLHILSITAKAIIRKFDIPKARNNVVLDQAAQALASLAEGLDVEEQDAYKDQECRDNEVDDPPLDQWVDLHNRLTDEKKEEIKMNIRLVQTTLTKVSTLLAGRVEIDLVSSCTSLCMQ